MAFVARTQIVLEQSTVLRYRRSSYTPFRSRQHKLTRPRRTRTFIKWNQQGIVYFSCSLLKLVQKHNAFLAALPREEVVQGRARRRPDIWCSRTEQLVFSIEDCAIHDLELQR
jgi:hypothetical protein